MGLQDEIIRAINVIVDKKLESANIGSDLTAVVTSNTNGKYQVLINGHTYNVTNGLGTTLNVGQAVWVRNPGNMAKAFIEALR